MSRKRVATSGTSACTCDKCGVSDPSTVKDTKHRRCGGAPNATVRAKHSPNVGVRGTWV